MRSFALVAVGGAAGTLARHGVAVWLNPDGAAFPLGTFVVNATGSFLLGALLTILLPRGDDGRQRVARLLLGTGFLGGYTTYSALAVETGHLVRDGHAALGLVYALGSVVAGLLAALAGIVTAQRAAR